MVCVNRVAHHVIYVICLNAQSHELSLEELTKRVDAKVVASVMILLEKPGLVVEAVNQLVDLFLSYRPRFV